MARKIKNCYVITGTLTATSPLHVGGLGGDAVGDPTVDMPLALNGAGQVCIPGTSMAGVLRAFMARQFGKDDVRDLWGWQEHKGDDGAASFMSTEDAVVMDEILITEIRDGVGIDRIYGGAANSIKYDREIVPKGTRFGFELKLETPVGHDGLWDAMTGHLLEALQAEKVRFGAAKSRGLGKVRLDDITISCFEVNSRVGILALLAVAPTALSVEDLLKQNEVAPKTLPLLDISIKWKPVGPVLVKADAEGVLVDMVPLVSFDGENLVPVIPGSSIKGGLRSSAERIWRTVTGHATDNSLGAFERFNTHLAQCTLVETIFGAANKDEDETPIEEDVSSDTSALPGLSVLTVEDCYAEEATISRAQWETILGRETDVHTISKSNDGCVRISVNSVADNGNNENDDRIMRPLMDILAQCGWKDFVPAMHVAIDRWTGGAADHFLYSILEPHNVSWPDIELCVDMDRLAPQKNAEAALALLLQTLQEFADGKIPLGFGGNRGMGDIDVSAINLTSTDSTMPLLGTLKPKSDFEIAPETLDKFEKSWIAYLDAIEEETAS